MFIAGSSSEEIVHENLLENDESEILEDGEEDENVDDDDSDTS